MTALAEHIIVARAENRPPILEKSMYDSWASRIRLFIKGKKHGRMMLNSIDNGPLVYPTVKENGQTRYFELTEAQQLQNDCDVQATNIIFTVFQLMFFPPPFISPSMTPQSQAEFPQLDFGLAVLMFQQGEDPIECINKAMAFLSALASRGIATTLKANVTVGPSRVVKYYNCQGEGHMARQCTQPKRPRNVAWFKEKLLLAEAQERGQILDEEQLAFLANPAKKVLMENLSSCDPEILSEDTNPSAPNDLLVLSLVEQMTDHVAHLDKENQPNKMIQPTLYDGNVIAKEHVVISMIDDEETLILEEESRSKMLDKQYDPISIEKKIKISPIDYLKLNKIKENFEKHFVTQKKLSAEQAFWLKHSSHSETPVTSHTPVIIEVPRELPKEIGIECDDEVKRLGSGFVGNCYYDEGGNVAVIVVDVVCCGCDGQIEYVFFSSCFSVCFLDLTGLPGSPREADYWILCYGS
nr:hypothetical protein [Tanacetum cinerariifolium]